MKRMKKKLVTGVLFYLAILAIASVWMFERRIEGKKRMHKEFQAKVDEFNQNWPKEKWDNFERNFRRTHTQAMEGHAKAMARAAEKQEEFNEETKRFNENFRKNFLHLENQVPVQSKQLVSADEKLEEKAILEPEEDLVILEKLAP